MNNAFREFMTKLIDYAGLFPPAELSPEKSIMNYNCYLESSDNWMLSQFIIPAGLLNQAASLLKEKEIPESFSFSVIISNAEKDLENILKFKSTFTDIKVGALEVKPQMKLEGLLNKINIIRDEINKDIRIFVESTINPDNQLIEELVKLRNKNINIGYKLRTGGVSAEAFTSPDIIASVIKSCAGNKIPFKATAGLHHPFTHYNKSINSKIYGFINLFAAGIFTVKFNLDEEEIKNILTDENPNNFLFDDNNFSWSNYEICTDVISYIRKNYFTSFGSCSFDEPREDLRKLKLL